jgi:hypothetical protein
LYFCIQLLIFLSTRSKLIIPPQEFEMKRSFLPYALFVALPTFCTAPSYLHASPIFVENFNTATVGLAVTTAGAFSAIGGTNVDIVGGILYGSLCAGPESGNCVDMAGSNGNPFGNLELTTPLNLAAGVYDLSFDLIGSGRGQTTSTTVKFGPYSQTFILTSGDITSGAVANQAVTIAGGLTQLQFLNNGDGGNPNIGALLDNVSISAAGTSTVPEPGTLSLMAIGLLAAAIVIHRRFQI